MTKRAFYFMLALLATGVAGLASVGAVALSGAVGPMRVAFGPPPEEPTCEVIEQTVLRAVELIVVPGYDTEVPIGGVAHMYRLYECPDGLQFYVRGDVR